MSNICTKTLNEIKCAWVTPVLGVEGNLLYFGPLLRNISKEFNTFTVYTGEYKGNEKDIGFKIKRCGKFKKLYKNERLVQSKNDSYVSGFSIASPAIFKTLLREKPDLIIINEFSLFSLYASLIRYFNRSRVLCIVESRPRIGGGALSKMARLIFRKIICATSDAFLTNNTDGFNYLTETLGVNKTKIITKPYLVSDLSASISGTENKSTPYDKDKINFLYVGQLVQRKGLHLAIESINLLSKEHKARITFNIVGDGPFQSDLKNLVKKYNLNEIVIFHGRVPYESLYNYYSHSSAFLFPTLSDYRALSPFEALSFGLPIFASIHDGGITETVIDGENGQSFDPNETSQLTQALELFINENKQAEYSLTSRKIASTYNLESAVDAILSASSLAFGKKHNSL